MTTWCVGTAADDWSIREYALRVLKLCSLGFRVQEVASPVLSTYSLGLLSPLLWRQYAVLTAYFWLCMTRQAAQLPVSPGEGC